MSELELAMDLLAKADVNDMMSAPSWVVVTETPKIAPDEEPLRHHFGPYYDMMEAMADAQRTQDDLNAHLEEGDPPHRCYVQPMYPPDSAKVLDKPTDLS